MKKFLPKTKNNTSGFTLIELLVVISIIAFLAVIGIASFTNAQKVARDGRRRADIEAISTALEANRDAVGGKYVPKSAALTTITDTSTDTSPSFDGMFAGGKRPKEPDSSKTYTTKIAIDGTAYTVCTVLELDTTGNSSDLGTGTTFTQAANAANFCRKSQQ